MKERNYILLFIVFVLPFIAFAQDGKSLILIHNYPDKMAIDAITNPSDGNIAYNTSDKSFYLYDAANTKWIIDSYYKAITTTTGALPLDESHYTVIINAPGGDITLPPAGDFNGREYVLKNTTSGTITITDYKDNANLDSDEIPAESVLKLQSDGADWHQVNNYSVVCESGTTVTPTILPEITDIVQVQGVRDNNNNQGQITFANPHPNPTYTELEIILTDAPYDNISITSLKVGNSNVDINNVTFTMVPTTTGSSGNYDYIFSITNINLPNNNQFELDYTTNANGSNSGPCNSGQPCAISIFGQ